MPKNATWTWNSAMSGALVSTILALMTSVAFPADGMNDTALANPGTVSIDDPGAYSAVYAISDVHGMFGALQKLLSDNHLMTSEGHWSGGSALLVVVGDSIDKGAQSLEVIDTWIRLQAEAESQGGRVLVLLGNHEAEFLANPTPSNEKAAALLAELRAKGVPVSELTDTRYPRARFLRSLPVAARVGRWLFCHAGFLPELSWSALTAKSSTLLSAGKYGDAFLIGDDSILEAKKWWTWASDTRTRLETRLDRAGLAGVIFGHQPKALNVEGSVAVSEDRRLVKIDNGMAPEAGSHAGSLLLISQPGDLGGATLRAVASVGGKPVELSIEGRTGKPR